MSDLTISNLDQTLDVSYHKNGRDTRPHRLRNYPPPQIERRINYYPNSHQNIQALRPEEARKLSMQMKSRGNYLNQNLQKMKSEEPIRSVSSIRTTASNFGQNMSTQRTEDTMKSLPSRKSSKIRKNKKRKNNIQLQEEISRLEEKRQEQINRTRGMYNPEARKLRRPNNNEFN